MQACPLALCFHSDAACWPSSSVGSSVGPGRKRPRQPEVSGNAGFAHSSGEDPRSEFSFTSLVTAEISYKVL